MVLITLALAAFLIILDQVTKLLIVKNFDIGEIKEIISIGSQKIFSITHVRNSGAAWSIMEGKTIILIIFPIIIVGIILFLLFKGKITGKLECISYSLIMVHVGLGHGLGRIGHREVAANEVVEGPPVGICAENVLDGTPVGLVHVVLCLDGIGHEYEVADEVGRREVLAGGVHRLEDRLRLVLALAQRNRDDLEAAQAGPDRLHVIKRAHATLEEAEVLEQALRTGNDGFRGVLEVVNEGLEGDMVVLGERELVVVLPRPEVVGEVPAVDNLLAREGQSSSAVIAGQARQRNEQ